MSVTKKQFINKIVGSQADTPVYSKRSKMNNYEIIYDSKKEKMRAGFYNSPYRNYTPRTTDQYYIVDASTQYRTDLISYKFYGSSQYDWIIEDANNIEDPIKDVVVGTKIVIPMDINL